VAVQKIRNLEARRYLSAVAILRPSRSPDQFPIIPTMWAGVMRTVIPAPQATG
jgi:hypothetical protein